MCSGSRRAPSDESHAGKVQATGWSRGMLPLTLLRCRFRTPVFLSIRAADSTAYAAVFARVRKSAVSDARDEPAHSSPASSAAPHPSHLRDGDVKGQRRHHFSDGLPSPQERRRLSSRSRPITDLLPTSPPSNEDDFIRRRSIPPPRHLPYHSAIFPRRHVCPVRLRPSALLSSFAFPGGFRLGDSEKSARRHACLLRSLVDQNPARVAARTG